MKVDFTVKRLVRTRIGLGIACLIALAFLSACRQVDTTQTNGIAQATRSIATTASSTVTTTTTASPTQTVTRSPTPAVTETPSPSTTPTPTATLPSTSLPTPDGVQRQVRVPILMYHYLSNPPDDADRYRRDLSVPPELFEQHLAYLKEQGYQTISFEDLTNALALGRPLPPDAKPIIITFDDGYLDNYQNALPLLHKYGFTGVFFVVTELAERASAGMIAPDGLRYADAYMTWDQLRVMTAAGMDVECHARVHEDLTENDDERLIWQVLGCREMIESNLGRRPRYVAFPSGIYDERVAATFASDGYWGGITTQQGVEQDSSRPFELKRLRVRSTTSTEQLAELLAWKEE